MLASFSYPVLRIRNVLPANALKKNFCIVIKKKNLVKTSNHYSSKFNKAAYSGNYFLFAGKCI